MRIVSIPSVANKIDNAIRDSKYIGNRTEQISANVWELLDESEESVDAIEGHFEMYGISSDDWEFQEC